MLSKARDGVAVTVMLWEWAICSLTESVLMKANSFLNHQQALCRWALLLLQHRPTVHQHHACKVAHSKRAKTACLGTARLVRMHKSRRRPSSAIKLLPNKFGGERRAPCDPQLKQLMQGHADRPGIAHLDVEERRSSLHICSRASNPAVSADKPLLGHDALGSHAPPVQELSVHLFRPQSQGAGQ